MPPKIDQGAEADSVDHFSRFTQPGGRLFVPSARSLRLPAARRQDQDHMTLANAGKTGSKR
jgi:hypothetical protein